MRISIISFTDNGIKLEQRLLMELKNNHEVTAYFKSKLTVKMNSLDDIKLVSESLKIWTGQQFKNCDMIIFIGACGIAVRSIAAFVDDKYKDPAVIVVDELGRFTIPLLSGHVGGGNELTLEIAKILNSIPVVTTATDLNGLFAVDVFAKKNNLYIKDRELAKDISAKILQRASGKDSSDEKSLRKQVCDESQTYLIAEEKLPARNFLCASKKTGFAKAERVNFYSEYPIKYVNFTSDKILSQLKIMNITLNEMGKEGIDFSVVYNEDIDKNYENINDKSEICDEGKSENINSKLGILVSIYKFYLTRNNILCLVPKIVSLGIGCKKGIDINDLESFVLSEIDKLNIDKNAIEYIASIDIKKEEHCLIELSDRLNVPFKTYSKEALNEVELETTYEKSDFVKQITGVDNVCERAAKLASDMGNIILHKTKGNGITLSIAVRNKILYF